MKCPTCGNILTPGEVFCGQCGTPAVTPPGYQAPTHMNMPSPRSGLLSTAAYGGAGSSPNSYQPGPATPAQIPFANGPANSYQHTGFYHDATEAMPPIQSTPPGLLPGYQQQGFPGSALPAHYPDQNQQFPSQAMYPFQTGNYAGPLPAQHPFNTGLGYNYGPQGKLPPPPQKQNNQVILIVCITLVLILLGAVSLTTYTFLNRSNTNQAAALPTVVPTAIPTTAPTPSPTPVPTPSPIPTPAPDAGFAWYGIMTEFPLTWQGAPATNSPGVQFTNPTTPEVYASFKALGATGSAPNDVLMNDVQTIFGSQSGYTAPTPPTAANATIGGAPWYAVAMDYNDAQNQPVHVEVYATVYQGKAYIIELQAPDTNNQFDAVKQQYFVNMLVKFQFLPTT
jgi:hypothetical protein